MLGVHIMYAIIQFLCLHLHYFPDSYMVITGLDISSIYCNNGK